MAYILKTETKPELSKYDVIRFNTEEEFEVLQTVYGHPVNNVWGRGHSIGWFGKDTDGYHAYTDIVEGTKVTRFHDVFELIAEQPKPGVKYVWYIRKETEEPAMMLRQEPDNKYVVLTQAGFLPHYFQKYPKETNSSFTVEEIKRWGYDPSAFDFYPLIEEPKYIWVSEKRDEEGDGLILRRRGENGAILTQFYYPESLEGTYQSSDNYHLTEVDLTKWGYSLQGWVKVAIEKGNNYGTTCINGFIRWIRLVYVCIGG